MAALILADKNLRNTNETSETISKENPDLHDGFMVRKTKFKFKNIERLINNS